ncbi:hypothetical protein B0T25DRAFT_59420 [Lasiosphaeria hispida]|uniref:Uncharacterized protein n=1 Tax=Lasiosphaeria hispida TaxID=260671 RepID=A0AAJ0HWX5_9PEZI|nr:hypothetical protein B0T25DRAFT_59420 [Lasiosphaeria hispida]
MITSRVSSSHPASASSSHPASASSSHSRSPLRRPTQTFLVRPDQLGHFDGPAQGCTSSSPPPSPLPPPTRKHFCPHPRCRHPLENISHLLPRCRRPNSKHFCPRPRCRRPINISTWSTRHLILLVLHRCCCHPLMTVPWDMLRGRLCCATNSNISTRSLHIFRCRPDSNISTWSLHIFRCPNSNISTWSTRHLILILHCRHCCRPSKTFDMKRPGCTSSSSSSSSTAATTAE